MQVENWKTNYGEMFLTTFANGFKSAKVKLYENFLTVIFFSSVVYEIVNNVEHKKMFHKHETISSGLWWYYSQICPKMTTPD